MTSETPKIELPNDIWKMILNESKETYFEKLKKELIKNDHRCDIHNCIRQLKIDFVKTIKKYDRIYVYSFRPTCSHSYHAFHLCGYFLEYFKRKDDILFVATNNIEKYKNGETSGYYFAEIKISLYIVNNISINDEEYLNEAHYYSALVDARFLTDKTRMRLTGSLSTEGLCKVKVPYKNDSLEEAEDTEDEYESEDGGESEDEYESEDEDD
jgi:hypothetical protein